MSTVLRFEEFGSRRAVVLEDDGRVAYAYLLIDEDIVSDVWLYNVGEPPELAPWEVDPRPEMPFQNPAHLTRRGLFVPRLSHDALVELAWDDDGVEVSIFGVHSARLEAGKKPGWSRQAAADGPVALAIVGEDGKPTRLSHAEYLALTERLAKDVASAAIDEDSFEVFLDDGPKTELQSAVSALARHLRYKHNAGDGCLELDDEKPADPSSKGGKSSS